MPVTISRTRQTLLLALTYTAAMLWIWRAGKDLNWDQINYHLYAPHLLVHGRWDQDYFAASIQSYLNPISYLPFYGMVSAGWNDILIALALGTFHFLNIVLAIGIARLILPPSIEKPFLAVVLSTLLALAAPIFLLLIGSTFNDPTGSVFILLALFVVLRSDHVTVGGALSSGIALGIATGMKLTSGTFPFAILAALFVIWLFSGQKLQKLFFSVLWLTIGCFLGFVLTHGFWSWKLWTEFSNPFFPFFNGVFKSPEFLPANYRDVRFMGPGLLGLLTLPFEMMRSEGWLYIEAVTPDIRVAALTIVMLAALALRSKALLSSGGGPHNRRLLVVTTFFLVAYFMWGSISRIGRYALPLFILAGPLLVTWLYVVTREQWARVISLCVLALQIGITHLNDVNRWTPTAWEGKWFNVKLPKTITAEPASFITIQTQPMGFLAYFLHPASSMSNIMGMYTMPTGAQLPPKLDRILRNKKIFVIVAGGIKHAEDPSHLEIPKTESLNNKLAPYGLRLQGSTCEFGEIRLDLPKTSSAIESITQQQLLFCPLDQTTTAEMLAAEVEGERYDGLFDAIEDRCVDIFEPKRVQTISETNSLARSYLNTVNELYTENGILYSRGFRVLFPEAVGSIAELQNNPASAQCPTTKPMYLK